MPSLMSFAEALGHARDGKKHVMLGNGFSIACQPKIFSYTSLFDSADFAAIPNAKNAFATLGTTDFEAVMRALQSASALVALYEPMNKKLAEKLRDDADRLREVLVKAIAENHPDYPGKIDDARYQSCRTFLANFGDIYTLNYDLLLYWALMHDELPPPVKCDDGFRTPEDGEQEYVTWEPENTYEQNVHYLHGGLHIFDDHGEIQKYTWKNTGVRLMDQIRTAMKANKYPVFVAEGESEQKVERIQHSGFLHKAHRSLLEIGGNLFLYGHGLNRNDEHTLAAIVKSKVERLYVSIYGDPTSPNNKRIIARANKMPEQRSKVRRRRKPLAIYFYDAATAKVWG